MWSWIGDKPADLTVKLFSDADFSGDKKTSRSTSGVFLQISGPNSAFVLSGQSKKQTCVSHSTPEAEIVAADLAIRSEGLPALHLWDLLLDRNVVLDFQEDNAAAIQIMKAGRSSALGHLGRTHRVNLVWLSETISSGQVKVSYCKTDEMAADIFTKAFSSWEKWHAVGLLIGHVTPSLGVGQPTADKQSRKKDQDRPAHFIPGTRRRVAQRGSNHPKGLR